MCGVCLEYFDKPLMLPCTHNFCKKCIEGILSVNSRPSLFGNQPRSRLKFHLDCPLCQRSIELEHGVESLTVNRILENIITLHKKDEPLSSNEAAWKLDSTVSDNPCLMHNAEPMSLYCLTCNRAVCKSCDCVTDKSSGTIHKCVPIKEQADQYQMKISNAIGEIKRKIVPINDEIQLLKDMMEQIKVNEESIKSQLDNKISGLIQSLKSQQEELLRQLHNDIMTIKRPIDEQLRKHTQLKKTVDDHLKRLNSIKVAKDTGLRIKLMKESERQLNSLLCFDMPMFGSKDMPIVDMPIWEVDKEAVLQSIQQLQWKKSGGSKPDDLSSQPSSARSSRQSSREDDTASLPKTPPVSFEPSPSAMSFGDATITRSTMTKKQKPKNFDHGHRKDQDNIQPNIVVPNIQPNIPITNSASLKLQESSTSSSQPMFPNVGMSTTYRISTQPSSTTSVTFGTTSSVPRPNVTPVATTAGINTVSGSKPDTRVSTSSGSKPPWFTNSASKTSWFSSTVVPSTSNPEQTMITAPPCTTEISHEQPSTLLTQFSNIQPKSNVMSMAVPKEVMSTNGTVHGQMPPSLNPKSTISSQTSRSDTTSNIFTQRDNNISQEINFQVSAPQPPRSDTTNNASTQRENGLPVTKPVNFPVPNTADFIPQSGTSSSVSTGTNTVISQNRGLLRKPKSEYGNRNEINKATLMAMVSDQGDIGLDTVIKSMETVRLGVRDDSNIPLNGSNIPRVSASTSRIDRRASTGTTDLPTQSNISFRTANLPTISAEDFSPTPHQRSSSPSGGARKTLKPKKKITKLY